MVVNWRARADAVGWSEMTCLTASELLRKTDEWRYWWPTEEGNSISLSLSLHLACIPEETSLQPCFMTDCRAWIPAHESVQRAHYKPRSKPKTAQLISAQIVWISRIALVLPLGWALRRSCPAALPRWCHTAVLMVVSWWHQRMMSPQTGGVS